MFASQNLSEEEASEVGLKTYRGMQDFYKAVENDFEPDVVFVIGQDRGMILAEAYDAFFKEGNSEEKLKFFEKHFCKR